MDLISPGTSSSEDAWDIAAENSPIEEEKEEEYIDIEDILAPPSLYSVESRKTGRKLKKNRSGSCRFKARSCDRLLGHDRLLGLIR
jgi:hypothetical protein